MSLLALWSIFGYYIYFSMQAVYMQFIPSLNGFISISSYWMLGAIISVCYIYKIDKNFEHCSGIVIFLGAMFGLLLYAVNSLSTSYVKLLQDTINYYFLWCFPALVIGTNPRNKITLKNINRCIDPIILLFFVALLFSYIESRSNSKTGITLGHASYQNYSYCASFALVLDMYMIIYAKKDDLFGIFRKKFYNILRIIMIPLIFIFQIAGGGRGALVLTCVAVLTIIIDKIILHKRWFQLLGICILIVAGLVFVMPVINNNEQLNEQFSRATAFIDDRGNIDMEKGSSGRDVIYKNVFEKIKERPILGYGPLGPPRILNRYCHNLYLDVMFEGGILYLSLWLFFTWSMIRTLIIYMKRYNENISFLFLFLCAFIPLMFSAYYPMQGGLWFFLGFTYTTRNEKLKG